MLAFIVTGFYLNMVTVILAHITFSIPYVVLSVMPKVKQLGKSNYEAALDLGATPAYAFRKVVLPELRPGIISGFLLAFTMSVDDFVITHFTRGAGINTISTLIYGQVKVGIRPTLFALSTLIFVTVLIVLTAVNVVSNRPVEEELPLLAACSFASSLETSLTPPVWIISYMKTKVKLSTMRFL